MEGKYSALHSKEGVTSDWTTTSCRLEELFAVYHCTEINVLLCIGFALIELLGFISTCMHSVWVCVYIFIYITHTQTGYILLGQTFTSTAMLALVLSMLGYLQHLSILCRGTPVVSGCLHGAPGGG